VVVVDIVVKVMMKAVFVLLRLLLVEEIREYKIDAAIKTIQNYYYIGFISSFHERG
jgi:hypothetical protein